MSLGAQSIEVEYKDGREWVIANKGAVCISIANYKSSSADAKELHVNLYAAAKKPVRTVIGRHVYILKVSIFDRFGEDAFAVSMELAPKLDPSNPSSFTAKQGQYLAFIEAQTTRGPFIVSKNPYRTLPETSARIHLVAVYRNGRTWSARNC